MAEHRPLEHLVLVDGVRDSQAHALVREGLLAVVHRERHVVGGVAHDDLEPGVFLEYISEDLILPRMNNYPPDSLEQYAIAFKKLLDRYSKNLPKNLKIDYFRVGDKHDKDKIIAEVEKLLPERRNNFEKLSVEGKERELKRSHRSIYWQGREDLSKLDEKARLERTIESRLIELAYYSVESRPEFIGDYFYGDDHICICFSFGLSHDNSDNDLTLGSTHSSVVDYWIGRGILEKHGERFIPRIVSKEQYESLKGNLTTYPSNLIDMKNFQAIEVYDGVVNFS